MSEVPDSASTIKPERHRVARRHSVLVASASLFPPPYDPNSINTEVCRHTYTPR